VRTAENVQTEAVDGVWPMLEAVDGRGNGADVHNGFARPTPSSCTMGTVTDTGTVVEDTCLVNQKYHALSTDVQTKLNPACHHDCVLNI